MRQAQGPASGAKRTIVPKALGNRTEGRPIEVDYTIPTYGERRRLLTLAQGADTSLSRLTLYETAAREHVLAVRSYKDDNGRAIETAEQFVEHAEDAIFAEVVTEILERRLLTDDEKKVSPSPFGSESSAIQA